MITLDAVAPLMGGMAGSGMAGGVGGGMTLFPLVALLTVGVLLAVGLVGIKLLASETDDGTNASEPDETPVERLQRRYAEGELAEAEFERGLEHELERELEREETSGTATRAAESERAGETVRAW